MVPQSPHSDSDTPKSDALLKQLMQVLNDLKKTGKIVAIQICPQCKSPNLRSRETWYDIGGAMGITPPKFRCLRCGYLGRIILEATNADIDETFLDKLVNADVNSAQKLLSDMHQQTTKKSD